VLGHILQLRQATTYHDILRLLAREAQPVNLSDIYAETKATITHLRKLAKLDLIRFGSEEVWRDPLADRDFVPAEPPMLTTDQARVWGRIKMAVLHAEEVMEEGDEFTVDAPTPILLHGVTGSGKTEIYMRAIDYGDWRWGSRRLCWCRKLP
jgi:primosomal protein N' (replication factor Y)